MKKKPRDKKKDERKSTAAAYLLSLLFHGLIALLIGLLFGGGGGVNAGGVEGSTLVPIGIVRSPGKPAAASSAAVAPSRNARESKATEITSNESPVEISQKQKKTSQNEQPQVVKTKPRTAAEQAEHPGEGPQSGATTPGQEGGAGSGGSEGGGTGTGLGKGVGPGSGPFPFGVFSLNSVPDCKKDDADNDSLKFTYDVSYKSGDLEVVFSGGTAQADPATIEQTRRIIIRDFAPEKLTDGNKLYKGAILCRCGADPKCWLVQ